MRTHPTNRFIPRLEALESRWCPSCTINVRGGTMRIIGDGGANAVTVTDDGAGNVVATCDSMAPVTASGIRKIIINTKGGNDTVNFTATGQLNTRLDLYLALGSGNDTANLAFAAINSRLKLNADLGSGNDTINTNLDQEIKAGARADLNVWGDNGADTWILSVNEVRSKAKLDAWFDGGSNNDTLDVRLGDPIDAGAKVDITGKGRDGNDSLLVDATTFGTGANIAKGAELEVNLDGGKGVDTLTMTYEGEVDGELEFRLDGDSGNDTVSATATVSAGSTGKVSALVEGDSGNDNLTLNITDASAGQAKVKAKLDGGSGFDTCVHTSNVQVRRCEA